MITLLILGLAGTGLAFAALPVVTYALMLETCAERADVPSTDRESGVFPVAAPASVRKLAAVG